jgi:hypothetical protein
MNKILLSLFAFSGYVLLNNILFNLSGIFYNDYYIYIKGYLCKIEVFIPKLQGHFLTFFFLRFGGLLAILYSNKFRKTSMQAFHSILLFDILSVFAWVLEINSVSGFYPFFSSIQSIFFLSNHWFSIPCLLILVQIAVLLLLRFRRKNLSHSDWSIFPTSILSIGTFQLALVLFNVVMR